MASAAPPQTQPLQGMQLFFGAFVLALANFIVVLDMTVTNVSVPHIAGSLAISPNQGTWTITSYAVADAITVPLAGWLSQRFGSVRWFMVSLTGFGLFSMLCGVAQTIQALVLFRICQGFFGGPLMPMSQIIMMRIFPQGRTAIGIAIWTMTTTAAPVVGPLLGGYITENWSWPWIFFINLPVVALCLLGVTQLLSQYNTPPEKKPIDLVGLILLIVSVGSFQIMLDIGQEQDWFQSPFVLALALTAGVTFTAFLIWEWTDPHPIVNIRVFRHRSFAGGTMAISLSFGSFFAAIVLTPLWLQQVVGYTADKAGQVMAWMGVCAVLFGPLAAKVSTQIDVRKSISLAITVMAGIALLRTGWTTDSGFWTYALPQILQGMCMPFMFIGIMILSMDGVPPEEQAAAAGLMNFFRTLCGAIGTALAVSAFQSSAHVARSEMTGMLNGANAAVAKLQATGMSVDQARQMIERMVEGQAATLAMFSVFMVATVVFLLSAASVWIAPRPKGVMLLGGGH